MVAAFVPNASLKVRILKKDSFIIATILYVELFAI
jgi:hypothetical protein